MPRTDGEPTGAGGAPEAGASEPAPARYWLTRFVFFRLLGFIYLVAFLAAAEQYRPLIGADGLLPAASFLREVEAENGPSSAFWLPTLFWLDASDRTMGVCAWTGAVLALAMTLGLANVPLLLALWVLYMSFVHVGQIFYGYGWEALLLETGFLALFLAPPWRPGPLPARAPPHPVVIWLLRWLVFRLMLGAGLIKLRGDPCWRDLTCLVYHYETQPLPNPLSWYLNQLPVWFHQVEALFNHFVELVVPWMVFGPRRLRHLAGVLLVAFQVLLILSGNLSSLNWLTLAVCVACFDDGALARVLPRALVRRTEGLADEPTRARSLAAYALAVVVAVLSLNPVANMLSPGQIMNTSYDPFQLVNTYGAFGSVLRERHEVVIQGTDDPTPDQRARWIDYEFKCKPGDVFRRPCVVSPYHYRLDWQMWFAAMTGYEQQPWFLRLVAKLLESDPGALGLLAPGPFRDHPPRYVRALLFRYEFTHFGDRSGAWWRRTLLEEYLPPLRRGDPRLAR